MILALVTPTVLQDAVKAASRGQEDVALVRPDVARALRVAHPRVLVVDDTHEHDRLTVVARECDVPVVWIRARDLDAWESARRARMPPPPRHRFYGVQIRKLLSDVPPTWVDRTLLGLARGAGRPLPPPLRGMARRVLEDPARYTSLTALMPVTGITTAALRARFRRRDLPSPLDYLRWFRLLATVQYLRRHEGTIAVAALALGFGSSGNLARFTRSLCGRAPGALRSHDSGPALLVEAIATLLRPTQVEAWKTLGGTFVDAA